MKAWNFDDVHVITLETDVDNDKAFDREQFWIDRLSAVNTRKANGEHTERSEKIYDWHRKKSPEHIAKSVKARRKRYKSDEDWQQKNRWKDRVLTEDQVREIRENREGLSYVKLGESFGVSAATICLIRNRKRYADVN